VAKEYQPSLNIGWSLHTFLRGCYLQWLKSLKNENESFVFRMRARKKGGLTGLFKEFLPNL
jgi:hypothetical protein